VSVEVKDHRGSLTNYERVPPAELLKAAGAPAAQSCFVPRLVRPWAGFFIVQDLFQIPAPDKKPIKQKKIQHDSRTDAVTASSR
jgi:hypothetical protein